MKKILDKLDYKLIGVKEVEGVFGKVFYAITNKEYDSLQENSEIINCQFLEKYSGILASKYWIIFRRYNEEKKFYYLQVMKVSSHLTDSELEEKISNFLAKNEQNFYVISKGEKEYDIYKNEFVKEGTLLLISNNSENLFFKLLLNPFDDFLVTKKK